MDTKFAKEMADAIQNLVSTASEEMTFGELNEDIDVSWMTLLNRLPADVAEKAVQQVVDSIQEYDAYYNADDVCPGGPG
jgi:hypothetical protein